MKLTKSQKSNYSNLILSCLQRRYNRSHSQATVVFITVTGIRCKPASTITDLDVFANSEYLGIYDHKLSVGEIAGIIREDLDEFIPT